MKNTLEGVLESIDSKITFLEDIQTVPGLESRKLLELRLKLLELENILDSDYIHREDAYEEVTDCPPDLGL